MTAKLVFAGVLAALALAGCGGGQSDDQQIRGVVNHFTVDIGQQRYAQACGLTTGRMRSVCGDFIGGPSPAQCNSVSPGSVAGNACATLQSIRSTLSSFTSLTISKVVVSGSSATVAFNGSGEVMTVAKRNGKWLVASG